VLDTAMWDTRRSARECLELHRLLRRPSWRLLLAKVWCQRLLQVVSMGHAGATQSRSTLPVMQAPPLHSAMMVQRHLPQTTWRMYL
jgi:hypothetical protein